MEPFLTMVVTVIIAILGSGGLWTLIQKRTDKKDLKGKMLMGLAHDRLVYLSLQYIHRGCISKEEFENLHKYLYEPYEELGGNGTVKRLMSDVEKLPIKSNIYFNDVGEGYQTQSQHSITFSNDKGGQ